MHKKCKRLWILETASTSGPGNDLGGGSGALLPVDVMPEIVQPCGEPSASCGFGPAGRSPAHRDEPSKGGRVKGGEWVL